MTIKITPYCPDCQSSKIKKNGNKRNNKQNYLCKDCGRQFIVGNHALSYKGCHSDLIARILLMLVRGVGVRDIATIEQFSVNNVLSVLVRSNRSVCPRKQYYGALEVYEFWTYRIITICVLNKIKLRNMVNYIVVKSYQPCRERIAH